MDRNIQMDDDINIQMDIKMDINKLIQIIENNIRKIKNIINRIELELITIIPELSIISINDYITSNITESIINVTNMIYITNNIDNNGKKLIYIHKNIYEIKQILSGYLRIMKIKRIIPESTNKIFEYIQYIEYIQQF